jgi:hypothetical protein
MATVDGITAQKAQEILDQTIESALISGATLNFIRHDGSSFSAGDFTSYINAQIEPTIDAAMAPIDTALASIPGQVNSSVASAVPPAVAVTFPGITPTQMVNRLFRATLSGNITIDSANFPSPAVAGTQFAMVLKQDGTGGRTLTLNNIKRSQGTLALSTAAGAEDIIMFLFSGTTWYAGAMGVSFS